MLQAFNVLTYVEGQHYNSHYDVFDPESYGPQSSQRVGLRAKALTPRPLYLSFIQFLPSKSLLLGYEVGFTSLGAQPDSEVKATSFPRSS